MSMTAVTNDERIILFIFQQSFSVHPAQRAPIPTDLKTRMTFHCFVFQCVFTSFSRCKLASWAIIGEFSSLSSIEKRSNSFFENFFCLFTWENSCFFIHLYYLSFDRTIIHHWKSIENWLNSLTAIDLKQNKKKKLSKKLVWQIEFGFSFRLTTLAVFPN